MALVVMVHPRVQSGLGMFGCGLFFFSALELGTAVDGGPQSFGGRAVLLTTPWSLLIPVGVGGYLVALGLRFLRGRTEAFPLRLWFYPGLVAIAWVGSVVYSVLLWPALWSSQAAVAYLLYRHLGEPAWALFALVVLTSGAFAFGLGSAAFLRGVPSDSKLGWAVGVSGVVSAILWAVSLNGLGVFVTGDAVARLW